MPQLQADAARLFMDIALAVKSLFGATLCFLFLQILTPKSVLIGDGGDFVATASYVVRPRGPLRWLDPGAFGTLGEFLAVVVGCFTVNGRFALWNGVGVGGGFALAAKLVNPDHDVWLLWGDGSAGYSIAEYDTFKRHGVSLLRWFRCFLPSHSLPAIAGCHQCLGGQ